LTLRARSFRPPAVLSGLAVHQYSFATPALPADKPSFANFPGLESLVKRRIASCPARTRAQRSAEV